MNDLGVQPQIPASLAYPTAILGGDQMDGIDDVDVNPIAEFVKSAEYYGGQDDGKGEEPSATLERAHDNM